MKPAALVVENDAGTRRLLDVLLARFGIEADLVATGNDALLLLERVEYDLVFLDLILSGISGANVLAWLEEARPAMLERSIVISSAPPPQISEVRERWPRLRVIRKPFELTEIIEEARHVASQPPRRTGSLEEEFVRRSVRAGAKAGIVVLANETYFAPYLSFGYAAEWFEKFFPLRLDEQYPLCIAYRFRQPIWLASLTLAGPEYPQLVPVWQQNESRALAAVPLVRDGVTIGAAGWTFREPRPFSESEQQLFLGTAAAIAEAVWLPDGRPSATVVRP